MKAFHETKIYNQNMPVQIFTSKNFSFMAHWHSDVELIYVLDGCIQIGINSEHRLLSKGDFAICGSGDIHFYNSEGMISEILIIIFRSELIDSPGCWPHNARFINPFIDKTQSYYGDLPEAVLNRIEEIFHLLLEEFTKQQSFYDIIIKGLLFEFCGIALRFVPCGSTETKNNSKVMSDIKTIRLALNYIEDNYTNDISLDDLSIHASMSSFHFSRLFNNIC